MNAFLLVAALITAAVPRLSAQNLQIAGRGGDLSLKLEIQGRIDRGLRWLATQQKASGAYGDETDPAITALALTAIMGDPGKEDDAIPAGAALGYEDLLSKQQRDGGVYLKEPAAYHTALALMAFLHRADEPAYQEAIRQARRFLVHQQADLGEKGLADHEMDGGIGCGETYAHSDLSITQTAMEALALSREVLPGRPGGLGQDLELNWDAAIQFVTRCQNVPENDLPYLAIQDQDRGGFVSFPGSSEAGEQEVGDKIALRSYGSMTYAGLLSFIYAQIDEADPRVIAARQWVERNFSLLENPGLGAQGLFSYYYAMAKALTANRTGKLQLADGSRMDWKEKLALTLFDAQRPEGSWIHSEDHPVLVTCYALLTLEQIAHQL